MLWGLPRWLWSLPLIALVRIVAGFLVGAWETNAPAAVASLVVALVYAGCGILLLLKGHPQPAPMLLGGTFALVASSFVPAGPLETTGAQPMRILAASQTGYFQPVFLWAFAMVFPSTPIVQPPARWSRRVLSVMAAVCSFLVLIGFISRFQPDALTSPLLSYLLPSSYVSWFVVYVFSGSTLLYIAYRARHVRYGERRRVALFVAGFLLGAAPALLGSVTLLLSPSLLAAVRSNPSYESVYSLVAYAGLIAIPIVTMYAVLRSRVLGLREVARLSIRTILARQVAYATISIPLLVLGFLLLGRDGPGPETRFLPATAAISIGGVGLFSLLQRRRILAFVDRRFFPEYPRVDHELQELETEIEAAPSLAELAGVIRVGLEASMNLSYACLFDVDHERGELRAVRGETRPLPLSSPQVKELESERCIRPMTRTRQAIPALKEWSDETGIELIAAVSRGLDLGALGVGVKLSGMPLIRDDEIRLARIAEVTGRALERLRSAAGASPLVLRAAMSGKDCKACGTVVAKPVLLCPDCGSDLERSVLPLGVAGKFRLRRRIGAGGKGIVYQADDLDLDRKVAVKALLTRGPRVVASLREEARFMALLDHPGLAKILGMEIADGVPVLVLELFERGTLKDRLATGGLTWRESVEIGVQLADALEYLHTRHMLHGDVKPSNIGITNAGTCKLIDFGLARFVAHDNALSGDLTEIRFADSLTTVGPGRPGTPAYLPPEAFARPSLEVEDDLWALALTLYETVAGVHPYFKDSGQLALDRLLEGRIPSIREQRSDCPHRFANFLQAALSPEIEERPASARAFRKELQRFLA